MKTTNQDTLQLPSIVTPKRPKVRTLTVLIIDSSNNTDELWLDSWQAWGPYRIVIPARTPIIPVMPQTDSFLGTRGSTGLAEPFYYLSGNI